ncbi:hypothetical protein METESE_36340 [Mesoterricola sediminis]|uniref:Tetratricopeptide repeat protein n=2 Tax=Mesoterricola sediminis TaxID=2927980 RepID=A0AA48H7A8_9BACT|nr:hypothetical protein METESE_36340 [Mesoterricola sediminis]
MIRRTAFLLLAGALGAQAAYSPRVDLDAGRYLKAQAEADAVLARDPNNALALAARSQALTALVRLPEALADANRALALQPGLADGFLARALARAGLALQQKNLGTLRGVSAAMDDLRAAVKADPTLAAAWMALGVAYQQLPGILGGSTRRAHACAEALDHLNPVKGATLRGTVLAMDGDWSGAERAFGTAFAIAPRDPDLIYAYLDALGSRETRKALGEEAQKTRLSQEATRLLPAARSNARALSGVCDALLDAGRGQEAWAAASAAIPHADAPSVLRLELGKIAARSGVNREAGLASLDQVLREPLEGGTGGYGTAHWRKGQILKDLGRKAEARAAAQAALALDPKDSRAQKLLKEIS